MQEPETTDNLPRRGNIFSFIVKLVLMAAVAVAALVFKVKDLRGLLLLVWAVLMMGLFLFGRNVKEVEKGRGRWPRIKTPEDILWLVAIILGFVLLFTGK
ncbi:hypothetical protein CH330_07775 [candidate division WOR-3 bacterium JGI_Cruoil_03_51_56]|uniref:Uncharacterized protein n=1 Tax=candidate division WOR-3 bacterium JGI_Cruoil_03_51_56 TaxID=1973747 RepID=A0A235BSN8_UNCW3|nr:MAG: hypothetical protein CH330_07775 [candidate division WOR-3 bacterium JGI_Cruoil_03_51_56]